MIPARGPQTKFLYDLAIEFFARLIVLLVPALHARRFLDRRFARITCQGWVFFKYLDDEQSWHMRYLSKGTLGFPVVTQAQVSRLLSRMEILFGVHAQVSFFPMP